MNFIDNRLPEEIDMNIKNASGMIVLMVIIWLFIGISGFTKTEKEPDTAKDSPRLPGIHDDKSISDPPEYRLTVRQDPAQEQAGQPGHSPASTAENSTVPNSLPPDGYAMKRLPENNFGFSFELPDYWLWDLLPDNGGYLLSGPGGTEENEVIIVVQTVKKAAKPESSVVEQLQEVKAQIQRISGAEIRSEDVVTVSGRQVPFILVLYPGLTASREPATFAQVQLVVENELYYIWISYAAPTQYFQKYQEVFANLLTSFQITATDGSNPSNVPSTPEKANGRITVKAFNTVSASVPTPRVTVKAQGFGSGAKLLKLFAVSADGKLKELQSAPCSDGGTVDFNAVYNRRETKSFELRLYDAQEKVIARLKRENA